jgi:2-keto-3-deoxy-L-rhamnonate aldolase RhmA
MTPKREARSGIDRVLHDRSYERPFAYPCPLMASLRQRLADGQPVFGTWVNTPSPDIVETLADLGFDCVMLDLEHGEYGIEALPHLLRAARAGGCLAIVRTSHVSAREIGAALDAGADGVLTPGVSTAAEAAAIVQAAHYPPTGSRGAAPMTRAAGYGTIPFTEYRDRIEADVVVGAQIEGPVGLAALDEILATPHLDLAFIGPFDLSQHLGVPGDTSHPAVVEAMAGIAERAAACGVATGTWAPSAASARPWIDAGIGLVTVASSTSLFTSAASALFSELRT